MHGSIRNMLQRYRFRTSLLFILVAVSLFLSAAPAGAASASAQVKNIRLSSNSATTRVVFDLSTIVKHSLFTLHQPERVVIDLENAHLPEGIQALDYARTHLSNIRHAPRNLKDLRIVFDLKQRSTVKSFLLNPMGKHGYRLVIDVENRGGQKPVITANIPQRKLREIVVAIDAGHGGKDPGAVGRKGTREKDICLAVARKLDSLLRREPAFRPVMIRTGDHFLQLRDRIGKAREAKADIFVSVHADASPDKRARGSSVFVYSQNRPTSEAARWLAQRHNASDLVGGVSLDDKEDLVASVLLDLSQTATRQASMDLANDLLLELSRVNRLRLSRVEQAGFAVLKAPDIPSVLVETAFISNSYMENKLRSKEYQATIANAIVRGIKRYFIDNAPPDTVVAQLKPSRHVIRQGETLTAIAYRYQVSVKDLRVQNNLRNDKLRIGQELVIPDRKLYKKL